MKKSKPLQERILVVITETDNRFIDFVRTLNKGPNYHIVGLMSYNKNLIGKEALGLHIYSEEEIKEWLYKTNQPFDAILINPKELEREEKDRILDICFQCKLEYLASPDLNDWGKEDKPILHKTTIEDLLGRIPIAINSDSIAKNLSGKTIMVTGAAGSIGSEIVRQLARFKVGRIMLCDNAETPLHDLCLELAQKYPATPITPKICNVQDYNQMKHIMEKYKPHYIYHAAAYKHVPLMEKHPCEAVLTNVLGTKNVIGLAVENGVEAFVMISTDKAVNPSNVMGATKRIAEIYVQSLYKKTQGEQEKTTRIMTTRFGNVLGSNGSVIPYFEKQIESGGPVTVTHENIIRYFMTIPEACRLVLEAGNMGKGGEVFLFDMGDSVRIKDMAEKMIRLSGLEPYQDIPIKITGLRPGEKLYEELLYDMETAQKTYNRKIVIGKVREYDYDAVSNDIDELISIAYTFDKMALVKKMKEIVPEYKSQNSDFEELDA